MFHSNMTSEQWLAAHKAQVFRDLSHAKARVMQWQREVDRLTKMAFGDDTSAK